MAALTLTAALLLPLTAAPPVSHPQLRIVADQWNDTHPYRFDKTLPVTAHKPAPTLAAAATPSTGASVKVAAAPSQGMGSNVEQWRSLVALYFPADQVDRALRVMSCESGGNPNAYNQSGASGLMQVLASWADNFGYTPSQLFDPDINLYVASLLYYDGGWSHWVCRG